MYHPSALPPHMRKFRPLLPVPKRSIANKSGGQGKWRNNQNDYTPTKWSEYFTAKKDVNIGENTFRVYLHKEEGADNDNIPLLVLLHGGGYSALTWSLFVKSIVSMCHVRVLAIDIRGHGSSKTTNDKDLSIGTITDDINQILLNLYEEQYMPEIVLMGHSMGGALAVHYADKCTVEAITKRILGLIVIDVVEGTAKEALSQMNQVLRGRPPGFKSIDYAVEWYIRSGQVKNLEAAKISMPGQIKSCDTEICCTDLIDAINRNTENDSSLSTSSSTSSHSSPSSSSSFGLGTLNENVESQDDDGIKDPNVILQVQNPTKHPFVWRINLVETEPYWLEWFDNISQIFLSSKGGAKLLLLAGVDRLDGPMMVGQMQGKFQMQILPRVGHIIQEDDPDSVAHVVATYLIRNRFSVSKVDLEPVYPMC